MAKLFGNAKGNVHRRRKPFYKRFGFRLAVAILAVVGFNSINNKINSASADSKVPSSYKSALKKAKMYSDTLQMSKQAIYDQLTSADGENFKPKAAKYAVNHVKADWNENALERAKSYQEDQGMSTDDIRAMLTSSAVEKFTPEQADYAINHLPQQ